MAARISFFHAARAARDAFGLLSLAALFSAAPLSAQQDATPPPAATSSDEFRITRELSNRFREETRLVLAYMSSRHYGSTTIDAIDPKELIAAYMKELDYSKLFFSQADENEIDARFAATIKSEYLVKGNLYPAFEIFHLYRQRVKDRLAWVYARLEKPFDFTSEESYRPDRQKESWPANQMEADNLWEKRLKFEMLDGIINGEGPDQTKDRLKHRYERIGRALSEMESYEVEEMFLNSFTELFDPHSNFMSVEAAENFSIAMSNSLQGIGAILTSEDGYCTIAELIPGGPAELSGQVNPGDKIIAVAQGSDEATDVVDMKLTKVVKLIRGAKGSEVTLTIVPANNPTGKRTVKIVRDEVRLTEQLASARLFQVPAPDGIGTIPVGVINLPSFYGADSSDGPNAPTTTRDVQELLMKLQARGAKAIVLDLRRNGGGLLSEAIRLTGLFIKDGPVVQVRYENGRTRTDFDDDGGVVAYSGPLVGLVSRSSASASEICAGALQVLRRAVIVGDKTTHGKGTVQQTIPLDAMRQNLNPFASQQELGMLKITIQKFYLPDGASTQEKGVVSDIVIPSISEFLPIGETDLDHHLPWDSIAPALWNEAGVIAPGGAEVTPSVLSRLSTLSEKRRATSPEFDYLAQSIARFRDVDDKKDISLCEATRRAEREQDKLFRNKMEDSLDSMRAKDPWKREKVELRLAEEKSATHQTQLHEGILPNGRPRANNYYQKIFYFEDAKGVITSVNVEEIDYESAGRKAGEVAAAMTAALGQTVKEDVAANILRHLRNSDRGSNFNVEATFAQYLPEVKGADLDKLLPAFFHKLVDLDPDVLDGEARFDIPMREAARVAADWVTLPPNLGEGGDLLAKPADRDTPSATK